MEKNELNNGDITRLKNEESASTASTLTSPQKFTRLKNEEIGHPCISNVKDEVNRFEEIENGGGGLRISSTSDLSPICPDNDIEISEGIF